MTRPTKSKVGLEADIDRVIKEVVERAVKQEIEKATEDVKSRINRSIGSIVSEAFGYFEAQYNESVLTIRVKKENF